MTLEEYNNLAMRGKKSAVPTKEKLTTREALQAMSEFYEFDKKKTEFFIRQLELAGKI